MRTQAKDHSKAPITAEGDIQDLIGMHDVPRARGALRPPDWKDPVALRERLAGIHTQKFISLRTARTERAIVATLARLTGLDAETIRDYAREDAAMITAAERDAPEKLALTLAITR